MCQIEIYIDKLSSLITLTTIFFLKCNYPPNNNNNYYYIPTVYKTYSYVKDRICTTII